MYYLNQLLVLAQQDVSATTGLGAYTAFASLGVVGIIGLLCLYMVMHTIPNERREERKTLEAVSVTHGAAIASISRELHEAIVQSATMFASTLREYRSEQVQRDNSERSSRDAMLKSSDEKIDRLADSFQELSNSMAEALQALAVTSHSGILRKRREKIRDEESVLT